MGSAPRTCAQGTRCMYSLTPTRRTFCGSTPASRRTHLLVRPLWPVLCLERRFGPVIPSTLLSGFCFDSTWNLINSPGGLFVLQHTMILCPTKPRLFGARDQVEITPIEPCETSSKTRMSGCLSQSRHNRLPNKKRRAFRTVEKAPLTVTPLPALTLTSPLFVSFNSINNAVKSIKLWRAGS